MKKIILIGMLAVMLLIVACTPTKFTCADGTIVDDSSKCVELGGEAVSPQVNEDSDIQPVVQGTNDETVAEDLSVGIPGELQDIFDKNTKIRSVFYDYREGKDLTLPVYKTFLKGDKVRIDLPVQTTKLYTNEIDMVILNLADETAESYCVSTRYCEETGDKGAVSFNKYYQETPFAWLAKVSSAKVINSENVDGRKVIRTLVNGEDTYLVDEYYGIPLRVLTAQKEVYFDNIVFNTVTDGDLDFTVLKDDY